MLDILAQAYAASVWADGDIELRSHQNDRQILVHSAQPTAVDLTYVDSPGLHQLFEHDAVRAMFSSRNAHIRDLTANASMTENVVGTCRLLHPPGIYFREFTCSDYRFVHIPLLIGVHHQLPRWSDLLPNETRPTQILLWSASYLQLEMCPAFLQGFVA